jgi:hypothetical protein
MKSRLKQARRWWYVVGAVFLTVGVVITVLRYVEWRHLETDKFGQGWGDMDKPALDLVELFNDKENKVRFRLPGTWKVGSEMNYSVSQNSGNLTDLVDARVADLKNTGINLVAEREYISTEKANLTVITFEMEHLGGKVDLVQEAWAKSGEKLVILRVRVPEENWAQVKKTYWEIFKSVEI